MKNILTKIIVKCERDHILSYLINDENKKDEFFKNFFDKYFELLELGDEKPSLEMNSNDVQILIGMNIPGSKIVLENIIQYVNDLKEEFYNNEDLIRNNINEGEEFDKDFKKLIDLQENLINKVENELKKYEIFKKYEELEKENNLNEDYVKKIYQDYFILFLANQFNDINYSQLFLVLNTLIEKKYGENKENFIKDFSKTILWMEANSINIYMILDIFNIIQQYKKNLFEIIIRIINNNQVDLKEFERNSRGKKEVNFAFFLILDSCLKSIFDDNDNIFNVNNIKFIEFQKRLKDIIKNAIQLEINLKLSLNEVINLKIIMQIIQLFTLNEQIMKDEINEIFKIINNERNIVFNNDINNDENMKKLLEN